MISFTPLHIMLDLETASLEPNAAILQIGAVVFSGPESSSEFNTYVSLASCETEGMHLSQATLDWWDRQNPQLRARVFGGTTPIYNALESFHEWVESLERKYGTAAHLWSNGADFDLPILKSAYQLFGDYPFNFRNHRCYRTISALDERMKSMFTNNTAHDALEDAKYQARVASAIMRGFGNYEFMV